MYIPGQDAMVQARISHTHSSNIVVLVNKMFTFQHRLKIVVAFAILFNQSITETFRSFHDFFHKLLNFSFKKNTQILIIIHLTHASLGK